VTGAALGVVADDVTGACDLADAVCDEGMSSVVLFGVSRQQIPDCDCVVVALKSRTAAPELAVAESVAAAGELLAAGAATLYHKYCSTFDSTDRGNIGPVADALRALVGEPAPAPSIGTPATPRADRTVYQGHLFVGRQLLSDSPLRNHPLTPMRDSDLVAVLGRQTPHRVGLVPWATVARGPDAVSAAIADADAAGTGHLLLDALDDGHLDAAATALHRRAAAGTPVLAGGSAGLAAALARTSPTTPRRRAARTEIMPADGPRLIVSGSCSRRTREQIVAFPGACITLSPLALASDPRRTVDAILDAIAAAFGSDPAPVLVSSSAEPDQVAAVEAELGPGRAAHLLERASAEIAARAVETLDVRRLLVAGGETSGAVVAALGITALRIGPAVAPGLSWMMPMSGAPLAVLLKSGNFGTRDLFSTAWAACP
jgi:3-dehydrotetronate 4-kinase